jgi:hypothetical protein
MVARRDRPHPNILAICFMYGMANVGIAGLNLHVFCLCDGYRISHDRAGDDADNYRLEPVGLHFDLGADQRTNRYRHCSMVMFLVQGTGLTLVISFSQLPAVYSGFFLFDVGLGGSFVLQELIWATYFGRLSLGTVRGLGILVTYAFGAAGAPFLVSFTTSPATIVLRS